MANPARGTSLVLLIDDESTYGSDPTPGSLTLPVVSETLTGSANVINSDTLTGNRARSTPIRGNQNVNGAIVTEVSAQAYGILFKHLLGTDTPSGSDPYTHVVTHSDLPVGFVLDVDHGSVIADAYRWEHFNGCRIASAEFQFVAEGYQRATWNILGASHTLPAAVYDGSPTDNGHTPFSGAEMSLEEGGSSIAYVSRVTMRVNNNLETDKYAIGGAGVRRSAPEGFVDVEGEIDAFFEDGTLLGKAVNGTESSLKVTLTRGDGLGSSGNEHMEIYCAKLQYDRNSVPTPGPGSLSLTLPFKAYRASSAGPIQVTIKNAIATL